MKARPLHMHSSSESLNTINKSDELTTAKKRFQANISNGIDALVLKQGYSRNRAAHLILEQIRQSDTMPEEDEIFQVMHHLGLGIEGATKIIVVANALKRVQEERGFTRTSAIDYLSSCLTTMKLLGSVEKTAIVHSSPSSPLKLMDSPSIASTTSVMDESFSSPPKHSSCSSTSSVSLLKKNSLPVRPRRTLSKNNLKNLKRQVKPPKPIRKRKEDESIPQGDNDNINVDAQVAEKVQSSSSGHGHNCKAPSPNVARHTGKRAGVHTREHDMNSKVEGQGQPSKRQRLDSI